MSEDRQRGGTTSLGRVMPKLRGALGGKPSPLLSLIGIWPEIVGAELARQSRPEKLTGGRAKAPGTLHLRCTGAAALELQHRVPEILQRVNAFLGFTAVARIALIQAPLPPAQQASPRLVTPVDAATRRGMLEAAERVGDPELRAALKRLGQAIARDPGKP